MHVRTATAADLTFIRDLQRRFDDQIGYIPPTATEREIEWGHIFHASLNEDDAGFLLVQPALSGQRTTAAIIQAAVRMDAQRMHVGLALVEAIAKKAATARSTILQCFCRASLDANLFWPAAGFIAVATRKGGHHFGEHTILWRRALTPSANVADLPPQQANRGPGGRFTTRDNATPLIAVPGRGMLDAEPFNER